jgi:hypothetical protein
MRALLAFPSASLFGIAVLTSCSPDGPPTSTRLLDTRLAIRSALADAPQVLADALAGKKKRGEQDDMVLREVILPGFGGFFIDDQDQVVVYMKRSAQAPTALVRTTLVQAYASRTEPRIREVMPRAANARILDGNYTLSELIAVENRVASSPIRIPGYVGVGTSLKKNRVVVGFTDSSSVQEGLAAVVSLGVPLEAILAEVWGEIRVTATWGSIVRPTRGGIMISVLNRTAQPGFEEGGSHGFNVSTGIGLRFLTAGHVPNVLRGMNGITGDTVRQPSFNLGDPIGRISINPAWQTVGCGNNPFTGRLFDYCTDADVALGSFMGSVTGDRRIGTSVYEGVNGAAGTQQINNWYGISSVATPEFVSTNPYGIHKSGAITGTTHGELALPDAQVAAHMCWGTGSCNINDPNQGVWVLYWNVTKVNHAGWGPGDSGGPVFARGASPYYAVGIQVSGSGPNNGYVCTGGMACSYYFARWSFIEQVIGLGTLDPRTSP